VKKLFTFLFLFSCNSLCAYNDKLIDKVCQLTSKYYEESTGEKRNPIQFKVFIESSFDVANMFPNFFPGDNLERALKFYCYGGQESIFRPNYININIPGASYGNFTVKKFSVDYGWTGINEINTKWAYIVASNIQQNQKIRIIQITEKCKNILSNVRIPKKIKLKRINNHDEIETKFLYNDYKRRGYRPNRIRSLLYNYYPTYKEETRDDVKSLLIYRVIIETDRMTRNWKYETYDKTLYNYIRKKL